MRDSKGEGGMTTFNTGICNYYGCIMISKDDGRCTIWLDNWKDTAEREISETLHDMIIDELEPDRD